MNAKAVHFINATCAFILVFWDLCDKHWVFAILAASNTIYALDAFRRCYEDAGKEDDVG